MEMGKVRQVTEWESRDKECNGEKKQKMDRASVERCRVDLDLIILPCCACRDHRIHGKGFLHLPQDVTPDTLSTVTSENI